MLSEDDKWFAVSLRFMGTGFDPRDVEGRIGLPPTSMRVIGEKWTGKAGREYGPAKNNVWSHRLEAAGDVGFELQIRTLLDRIAAHSDAVRTLAGTDQVEAELFCGFGERQRPRRRHHLGRYLGTGSRTWLGTILGSLPA